MGYSLVGFYVNLVVVSTNLDMAFLEDKKKGVALILNTKDLLAN
jgi:hypothetical protein